jgi:hypothetical protein
VQLRVGHLALELGEAPLDLVDEVIDHAYKFAVRGGEPGGCPDLVSL